MNRQKLLKVSSTVVLFALITMTGCARDQDRDYKQGRRQGPPAEAIAACEGKQAGDSVEFTGRYGETIQAICRECNGRMAAVPDGMPPGGDRPD
ncbi:MAG: hypothetical protein PHP23_05300 [Desulfobacterales bacterium]|nr:hypothetical protein [Desulfobacterales bacterium]MDD4073743.1 hypothetical protein [Desulfobacterales bacterium]MDD4394185.1 hypothetical protein [Desulfobacterales bacterium]